MKRSIQNISVLTVFLASLSHAQASDNAPASVPYMPSWQARHQLQLLVDHAGLQLPLTHWPLPAAAVQQALAALPGDLPSGDVDVQEARRLVLRELQQRQQQTGLTLQLRQRAEGLPGFDDNYTPGSSAQLVSSEQRLDAGGVSLAGRLGLKLEQTSDSLAAGRTGWGTEGAAQARLEGSAAVLGWQGWNVQAFSHRHWWGPGWQSSMINGSNNPAWNGVGIQRGSVRPSDSPWLSWMGPWNLDVFAAQAQDPLVATGQPQGFIFSGLRLTMRPQPWLEVGLSRGLQQGGTGRPGGMKEFVQSFFGQHTNQDAGSPPDSSNQIAGFDARLRCPQWLGQCAAYGQWMGEDAGPRLLHFLPRKFMSLWGLEQTYGQGRYRVFAEYANANAFSLPWDSNNTPFPVYTNGVYSQGYTNGARWVGAAGGSGSQVTTLGWMDAQSQRMLKLHAGTVNSSLGAYDPRVDAPHGRLRGLSASQALRWHGLTWTPELSWTHLSDGQDVGANRRNNLRAGVSLHVPL